MSKISLVFLAGFAMWFMTACGDSNPDPGTTANIAGFQFQRL